jgi:tRNA(Ile)-lysidine synthase
MADFLPFEVRLARAWPPARWNDVVAMVGLSGGADSTALLRALCAIRGEGKGRLIALHYNHRWRGADSDRDEQFCVDLAAQLGVSIVVERAAAPADPSAQSEEAAREARYAFFRKCADAHAARYLILAHHRDDQVETVLMRLLRGSSLRGLAGIPRLRKLSEMTTIVRPLLSCPRKAIERYLQRLGQSYCIDATNADASWLRNRIRTELLPLLEANYAHQASNSIARLASDCAEATAFLDELAADALSKHAVLRPEQGEATLSGCEKLPPYLLRLMLVHLWREMAWPAGAMTRRRWRKLAADLQSNKKGSLGQYPGAILVTHNGQLATLVRP